MARPNLKLLTGFNKLVNLFHNQSTNFKQEHGFRSKISKHTRDLNLKISQCITITCMCWSFSLTIKVGIVWLQDQNYTLASLALTDRIGLMEAKFTHAVATYIEAKFTPVWLANMGLVELYILRMQTKLSNALKIPTSYQNIRIYCNLRYMW